MAGFHSYGTTLELGNAASPEIFSAIATVESIGDLALTRASIDVTHLSSTGAHRERIAGTQDSGPVSFVIIYQPDEATHMNSGTGLLALKDAGTTHNWQITLSDAATNVIGPFAAFVSGFTFGAMELDGKATATVELTITAEPTLP